MLFHPKETQTPIGPRDDATIANLSPQSRQRNPSLTEDPSSDIAKQLSLEDELALFVLFGGLVGLVILPPDSLLTLPACNIANDVSAGRHVALVGGARVDVDDAVEEIRFTMLTTEVTTYDVFMVGEVRLARLAAIDFGAVEIGVVSQAHDAGGLRSGRAMSVSRDGG